MIDFLERSGLRQSLEGHLTPKAFWATYPRAVEVEWLILRSMLGLERVIELDELRHDALLAVKLLLEKLPHRATVYRSLDRFQRPADVEEVRAVHREVLAAGLVSVASVILDLDSTVETVHGRQERASVGYNPRYHGRPSYQPLLAFEGQTQSVVHTKLRPGTHPSARQVITFHRQAKRQLPAERPVRFVRADAGFGSDAFFRELEAEAEQRPLGYTIKHRLTSHLQSQFGRKLPWRRLPSAGTTIIEAASLFYQAPTWAKARRVVLIRQRPSLEPAQLRLFEAFAWEYQAIVTNLDWDEEDVWHFYDQRCTCENGIKELKDGLGIACVNKAAFWANAADLVIKGIACNLFLQLKALAPPAYRSYTVRRFRRALLRVPGILARHARQFILHLPSLWVHRTAWETIRLALST